ncbi:MAG TPA: nucleotide exchange factor GrpE [Candidatus Enterenecus merdae]|nr:nucleotide exchange factor GrpE [Candidatus Enterenecus merdae]
MSEKKKDRQKAAAQPAAPEQAADPQQAASAQQPAQEQASVPPQEGQEGLGQGAELQQAQAALADQQEQYLRLAAEYDNYRKRTAKEKESAWVQARADTVAAFLPVYDNLERALKQQTQDEAYAKGVEMTMKGLQDVLAKLGVEQIPALGERFDPNCHNAVMHVEDESVGESTVVEVFQQGFACGDKVIRVAMVKVAN